MLFGCMLCYEFVKWSFCASLKGLSCRLVVWYTTKTLENIYFLVANAVGLIYIYLVVPKHFYQLAIRSNLVMYLLIFGKALQRFSKISR